ncbi:DUF523 domain-containing protein [Niallia nealsonii]|uniref:DUF523 domain-containing protein n=1 Tax=Niallia nealsonii TaxID=115979 RepID=A0A2N0YY14_9BACI|nr:DUF523 domain-containing protein [Niallia nealsonii]PKG22142.1 DUF523 domain-containing protein [Niallia nealsonii]
MIVVSSCLAGMEVRYNGTHCLHTKIQQLIQEKKAVAVCPELLGGFQTPREPAEIIGGNGYDVLKGKAKVIEKNGKEVTDLYIEGAYRTWELVSELQASIVVLKENSPSCGSKMIYNGEFLHKRIEGVGVTTALLRKKGIQVLSEEELSELVQTF